MKKNSCDINILTNLLNPQVESQSVQNLPHHHQRHYHLPNQRSQNQLAKEETLPHQIQEEL